MRFKIIAMLILISSSTHTLAENINKNYSFAVVPQQSAQRLAVLWGPILAHIQKETGIKLQFKTAKNIPEFENRLAQSEYDFAYMNPYHFTVFNRSQGYTAIAVRKDQPIKGIIVVRKDSPISSIDALADKTLAFPSPGAFAASILPRANLKQQNIKITPRYVSSHDSVYLNVAKGLLPAGGGVKRTFDNTNPTINSTLKILWTSTAYTPHAIAAHPNVKKDIRERIQNALVNMKNTAKGKKLLLALKIKNGLIKAEDKDWDDVRDLKLDKLDKLVKTK
jgi:phosphonate transport system substrate-binding protein